MNNFAATLLVKRKYRIVGAVLLCAALLLAAFLMMFNVFQGLMIQSLSQLNGEFVEQVDAISGTILDIIQNSAMQTFYSNSIRALRSADNLTNSQKTLALRDLSSFVGSSEFLSSVMVYNPGLDMIFTSEGNFASDKRENFHDVWAAETLTSRVNRGGLVPVKRSMGSYYCYSFLFFEENYPAAGALLLNVRADWYERSLLGISSGDNCVILDQQGKTLVAGSPSLASDGERIWPQVSQHIETQQEGNFILNEDTGWLYRRLENSGWYYLRSFNLETVSPAMTHMRNLAIAMLFTVFSFMIFGAGYITIKVYMPFAAIKRALAVDGENNSRLTQQVDMLLEDTREKRHLEHMRQIFGGELPHDDIFPVTLIAADTQRVEELRAFFSAEKHPLCARLDFGTFVMLRNCDAEDGKRYSHIISEALGCRCIYSYPRESLEELRRSRENINEIWQMRFLFSESPVMEEKLSDSLYAGTSLDTKQAAPLVAALRSGQLEEARVCWLQIFEKIKYSRYKDFRFAVRLIFKSISSLCDELSAAPLQLSDELLEGLDDEQTLHRALDSTFVKVVQAAAEHKKKKLNRLAIAIRGVIDERCTDASLSAQTIAADMQMSPVYIGRLFRQSTGMSISEAINRARVEAAKSLLLESGETVEAIAAKVGFENSKYFYVVFKDFTGCTPRQFRKAGIKSLSEKAASTV